MPKRVLIVEDHALLALSLQLALSARGWIVETTDGPTAADIIEHAHRFGPRSVLLDIRLGSVVGSGIDLIGPLRATGAEIVMLTAETDQDVLASCLEAGAAGWIGKHASLDEVEAALGDVREGRPLIGCAVREAMIDAAAVPPGHPAHRPLAVRAAHPARARGARPVDRRPRRRGDRRDPLRGADHGALPDPLRAAQARRPLAARRRRPRQPGRLDVRRRASSSSPDQALHTRARGPRRGTRQWGCASAGWLAVQSSLRVDA